jgi:hypothetical protein
MADEADLLDDLFHGCALAAFIEQAVREGGRPDSEATRRLAYRLYEEALAEKNGPTRSAASARSTGAGKRATDRPNATGREGV